MKCIPGVISCHLRCISQYQPAVYPARGERELLAAYRALIALHLALYRPPEPPAVQ
jgi:hypothetical protein